MQRFNFSMIKHIYSLLVVSFLTITSCLNQVDPLTLYDVKYVIVRNDTCEMYSNYLPSLIPFSKENNNTVQAFGKWIERGVDSVYIFKHKNMEVAYQESNEVGFARRYSYMINGRALPGTKLLNGIIVGNPIEQLLEMESVKLALSELPPEQRNRLDQCSTFILYDNWDIYEHVYTLTDGNISSFEVSF